MKISRTLPVACLILLVSSCSKSIPVPEPLFTTMENVSYGPDPKQKMDVYLPKSRSSDSTKTIVLIHGGAWSEGDKTDFNQYIDTLKKRFPDFALININYRLVSSNQNLFPTQENDVKAALDLICSKQSEYGISGKFVLLGASAGAHLAMLQAYKYQSPVKIKAVINFFGPSDMEDMYYHPASVFVTPAAIAGLFGGTPVQQPDLYFQSGPINFINAQSPPTISLQGGLDPLVRPAQQVSLHAKLNSSGVTNEYVLYPTEYHGWEGSNLVNSFDHIEAFIRANVN